MARLYQRGAYDKVIVIPAPFTGNEQQTGPGGGNWTHEFLEKRFSKFMLAAGVLGNDIWLITTTTGQNIHEQAAETAQIIDAAVKRLGPEGTISVLGYSLGGIGAGLTTARYQADPDWKIRLGVRPFLRVRAIGFGDAPLLGANVPRSLQDLLWRYEGAQVTIRDLPRVPSEFSRVLLQHHVPNERVEPVRTPVMGTKPHIQENSGVGCVAVALAGKLACRR